MLFVKDRYPAESFRIYFFGFRSLEFDCFVYEYVLMSFFRQRMFFYTSVDQVVLVSDHEEHFHAVPIVQQREVAISPVGDHDAMREYPDFGSRLAVRRLTVGNVHEFREQGVEVEQCMKLKRTLGDAVRKLTKHNAYEIGFISQDASFANYIRTMLEGIKSSISY